MIINLFPVGTVAEIPMGEWTVTKNNYSSRLYINVTFTPNSPYISSGVNWTITCSIPNVNVYSISSTPGDTVSAGSFYVNGSISSGTIITLTATRADNEYTDVYEYTVT